MDGTLTARPTEFTSSGSAGWPVATPVAIHVDEHTVDEKKLGGLRCFSDVDICSDRVR